MALALSLACAGSHPNLKISPENYPLYSAYKGGPARTGTIAGETGQSLEKLWQIKFRLPLYYSPAMADNYLFQPGSDKKIHVIEMNSGNEVAEIKLRRQLGCSPELADSLMAICEDGQRSQLLVINYLAGRKVWSKTTFGLCLPPAIDNDRIFWADGRGKINCADLFSGELIWSSDIGERPDVGPVLGADRLIEAAVDGSLICLSRKDGRIIWRNHYGRRTNSSPALSGDYIYICFGDGGIGCFDINNGNQLWHHADKPRLFYSPSVDSGGVYYGTGDGRFVKLDRNTGSVLWEYSTSLPIRGAAAITDNAVIFSSLDSKVYMLDKTTGRLIASESTGGMVTAAPAVSDGRLFIAGQDKNLYCFLLGDQR